MENKKFWFYLEPYVHLSFGKKKTVLFNTLNGEIIEISDNSSLFLLINKFKRKEELYTIEISNKEFLDINVKGFISEIKEKYFGDLIPVNWTTKKPIQMSPILYIQKRIGENQYDDIEELDYLNHLNIELNRSNVENNKGFQGIFVDTNYNYDEELDFKQVKRVFNKINTIPDLSIYGNDIFEYKYINELVTFIAKMNIHCSFYLNYMNPSINKGSIEKIKSACDSLIICISNGIDKKKLSDVKLLQEDLNLKTIFRFKVENESDLVEYERVIDEIGIRLYEFLPIYNGNNYGFFQKAIFFNKTDIVESKPSQNVIFTRQEINQLDFGNLFIQSDGNVYSNRNYPKLGNINDCELFEIINEEMYNQKNWFRIRKNVEPCNICAYNALCPPISNYEYAIGKYNLCHVWEN